MTKVTPGLLIPDSMGLNAQMRQQQRLDCTIPYPWALIEIYWTWPINGLRHVLRNNQFGPLMNSLEFFLDKRYVTSKDQRFNLKTIKSQGQDSVTLSISVSHAHNSDLRDSNEYLHKQVWG